MSQTKSKVWVINTNDNVGTIVGDDAIVDTDIPIVGSMAAKLKVAEPVPYGHKIALMDLPARSPILKYGVVVGSLRSSVNKGEHVHSHNMESLRGRGDLKQ